jgi:hypothetical protein
MVNCITTRTLVNRLLLVTDKSLLIRLSGENPEINSAGYMPEINPTTRASKGSPANKVKLLW